MSHYYRSTSARVSRRQNSSARQPLRRNQNTVAFASSIQLGPIAHTVLVALMITILGLIYLTQVTKTSSYGYDINERDETLTALQTQKEDLENENARLQALKNVASSDVAANLSDADSVNYAN